MASGGGADQGDRVQVGAARLGDCHRKKKTHKVRQKQAHKSINSLNRLFRFQKITFDIRHWAFRCLTPKKNHNIHVVGSQPKNIWK